MNFTEEIINHYFYDFVAQPPRVTINNIIKEFPKPSQLILPSGIKAYFISCANNIITPLFGIETQILRSDSTHYGSFFNNFVSASKNIAFWVFDMNQGTRESEIYRPAADVFKMLTKMYLLHIGHKYEKNGHALKFLNDPLVANFIAELPAKFFLDGMELIKNKGLNRDNINSWYDITMTSDFLFNIIRKSGLQALSSKVTVDWFVNPIKLTIGTWSQELLESIGIHEYLNHDYTISFLSINIPVIPPPLLWIEQVLTGYVLVPISRTGTYMINGKAKVLLEHNGQLFCKRFGEVLKEAQNNNITIEYKYDSYKHAETPQDTQYLCEDGKNNNKIFISFEGNITTNSNDQQMIVHYPKSEDFLTNLIGEVSQDL